MYICDIWTWKLIFSLSTRVGLGDSISRRYAWTMQWKLIYFNALIPFIYVAVVYYRVSNSTVSIANVENAHHSTRLLAQTTLRNVCNLISFVQNLDIKILFILVKDDGNKTTSWDLKWAHDDLGQYAGIFFMQITQSD